MDTSEIYQGQSWDNLKKKEYEGRFAEILKRLRQVESDLINVFIRLSEIEFEVFGNSYGEKTEYKHKKRGGG